MGKRFNNKLSGTILKIILLPILLFVASCSNDPDCILADDWGTSEFVKAQVYASSKYTYSGLSVLAGEPLEMNANGFVDLCPDNNVFDETSKPFLVDPEISTWQNTGISIQKDKRLSIFIKTTGDESSIGSSVYYDRRGINYKGKGLYALILPDDELPTDTHNSAWFWKDPNIDTDPTFFELYENDPDNDAGLGSGMGGYSGIVPIDGTLWLRYARTARKGDGTRDLSDSGDWESRWSPWKGKYAFGEDTCHYICNPAVYMPLCTTLAIRISMSMPPLFPAAFAGCTAGYIGHCEKNQYHPGQANCKWPRGDSDNSWTHNDYSDNSNGYEIEVTTSCPGTDGMYLDAIITDASNIIFEEVPLFSPKGCTPGQTGCKPQLSDEGILQTEKKYRLRSSSGAHIIPMDAAKNYDITDGGFYSAVAPASGQLWFRINDNIVKASDKIADPAGCNIETSSSYISPSNEPSGCVISKDPDVNPDAELCYSDYIDLGGSRVRDAISCSANYIERVNKQLTTPGNNTASYNPGCGFTNKNCEPPMGFTGYADNTGYYTVAVETTKVNTGMSDFFDSIVTPIKSQLFGECLTDDVLNEVQCGNANWRPGIVKKMYVKLIGDPALGGTAFSNTIRAALLLYIVIYAFQFMLGMIDDLKKDFVYNVLRVAVIQFLLTPESWEFFNTRVFIIFTSGLDELMVKVAGQFIGMGAAEVIDPITGSPVQGAGGQVLSNNVSNPFAFSDYTVTRLFSETSWKKIIAYIFSSPTGIIYASLLIVGIFFYLIALIQLRILYILAIIGISLMIVVSPIFIAFLLFNRTRDYFEGWVKYLASFILQPVFVFTAFAMFNIFIFSAFYEALYFHACIDCVLEFSYDVKVFDFEICLMKYYTVVGDSIKGSVEDQFFAIVIFVIIAQLMYSFNGWMARLAAEITTSYSEMSLMGATTKSMGRILDAAKAATGATATLIFNSGKTSASEKTPPKARDTSRTEEPAAQETALPTGRDVPD